MLTNRRKTRQLKIGDVAIGGGAPVSIQSMCNTQTNDVAATLSQIKQLATAGCQIIRVAVPDKAALNALEYIVDNSPVPVVADIHFDHKLALGAIKHGVHCIRLNPGNLSGVDKIKIIAEAAGEANIPIRVGANSGSVKRELLKDQSMAEALVKSTLNQCALLEQFGFRKIKVSLKSSNVVSTIEACKKFSALSDYPQHIGITESGSLKRGLVKCAVGIGALLLNGIGDTLRVSLTADPLEEVKLATLILESVGLRMPDYEMISCPTCGRTQINLFELTEKVELLLEELHKQGKSFGGKKIAVMGCAVNGPGEAREADIGLAGAKNGNLLLFENGEVIGAYKEFEAFKIFKNKINNW